MFGCLVRHCGQMIQQYGGCTVSNPENPNFDDPTNPENKQGQNPQESEIDFSSFFGEDSMEMGQMDLPDESQLGENASAFPEDLESFADFGTSEVEELIVPDATTSMSPDTEFADLGDFSEDSPPQETPVVAEEPKGKKGKKEKPPKKEKVISPKKEKVISPKKEKTPKVKAEKKPREPREKKPWDVAALCFAVCLGVMALMFFGVNAYAFMKHGTGSVVFLAIFDLLAVGALVIPILLRRSQDRIAQTDVAAGIAAISLIFGCMFLLANLAYNLS